MINIKELNNYLNITAGIEINDASNLYDTMFLKLTNLFLDDKNKQTYLEKNKFYQEKTYNSLKGKISDVELEQVMEQFNRKKESEQYWLLWDMPKVEKVNISSGEKAIEKYSFNQISKCYCLQSKEINPSNNVCFEITGKYNIDNVKSKEDFEILKENILEPTTIPFWVFDFISEKIGKELYVFDKSFKWALVLTHENDIFLYEKN